MDYIIEFVLEVIVDLGDSFVTCYKIPKLVRIILFSLMICVFIGITIFGFIFSFDLFTKNTFVGIILILLCIAFSIFIIYKIKKGFCLFKENDSKLE